MQHEKLQVDVKICELEPDKHITKHKNQDNLVLQDKNDVFELNHADRVHLENRQAHLKKEVRYFIPHPYKKPNDEEGSDHCSLWQLSGQPMLTMAAGPIPQKSNLLEGITKKASNEQMLYWSYRASMSLKDYRTLRLKLIKKSNGINKRINKVLNRPNHSGAFYEWYKFHIRRLRTELERVKTFSNARFTCELGGNRSAEDIKWDMKYSCRWEDFYRLHVKPTGTKKKKISKDHYNKTNTLKYYRKQVKIYFEQLLQTRFSNRAYQRICFNQKFGWALARKYKEALFISRAAVRKRKAIETPYFGVKRSEEHRRRNAAILDKIYQPGLYLQPKIYELNQLLHEIVFRN